MLKNALIISLLLVLCILTTTGESESGGNLSTNSENVLWGDYFLIHPGQDSFSSDSDSSDIIMISNTSSSDEYMIPNTEVLEIQSVPDAAWVSIDGEKQEQTTPATFLVTPGEHKIKVTKQGYTPYNEEIKIPDENRLVITLKPGNRGDLIIQTEPEGASVTVDGEEKGKTPLTITDLTFGEYSIDLGKVGYLIERKEVTFERDGQVVIHTFTTDKSIVRFRSIPTGAGIKVVGQGEQYKTPDTVKFDPGKYTFVVQKQGYSDEKIKVTLKPGDDISLDFVLTGPGNQASKNPDGTINVGITSVPEGASVSIDGVKQDAKTPGIYTVTPGDHQVRLSLLGYAIYDEEIAFPKESPLKAPLIALVEDHPDPHGPS